MRLFHRTTEAAADAILGGGFIDRSGSYMMSADVSGVWLSDAPLDRNEGTKGDALLVVEFSGLDEEISAFEVIEDGKPYREWIVPAVIVNAGSFVRRATEEEDAF
jgi:hypothetical protein